MNGTSRESIPIVTIGKELRIDSVEGFIYWNTGHAIECARLNGERKITYYPPELFRKQSNLTEIPTYYIKHSL